MAAAAILKFEELQYFRNKKTILTKFGTVMRIAPRTPSLQ